MRIGGALVVIAIGAILKFAVTAHASGVNVNTIGLILMIVGAVWLVAEIIWASSRRRTDVVHHTPTGSARTSYVEPNQPL